MWLFQRLKYWIDFWRGQNKGQETCSWASVECLLSLPQHQQQHLIQHEMAPATVPSWYSGVLTIEHLLCQPGGWNALSREDAPSCRLKVDSADKNRTPCVQRWRQTSLTSSKAFAFSMPSATLLLALNNQPLWKVHIFLWKCGPKVVRPNKAKMFAI